MARIVISLPRPARRRLERARRKTRDGALRDRIRIVLLYAQQWGCDRIAAALGIVPATAVRVAHRFLREGEGGLIDHRVENGNPKVDLDLLQALGEFVEKSPQDFGWSRPTWTRELMARELERQTGVRVSITTLGRMLRALKARWGMPGLTVICPVRKGRKKRWIRRILRVLESLPPGEVAFYEDELDVHLNPRVGRDWMMPRQQKVVVTPGKNEKRYVAGALAVNGREFVYVTAQRKNTDLFIALLEALRGAHPRARRIHLVLDNYVIHKSRRLERWLAKQAEVFVLHFLPPYSPKANRIERFWREVHANVTRNHRCKTIQQLMNNLRSYLRAEARRRRWKISWSAGLRHAA